VHGGATDAAKRAGLHVVSVRFYDADLPETQQQVYEIRTCHIPTPQTHGSTHYFIVHSRNFALDDDAVTAFMHDQLMTAFREDVAALCLLEQVLASPSPDQYEISIASDAPAVAMRRYLLVRANAANDAQSSTNEHA
jgi:Vanillate O-demethylase oxygenase C-terminal domain